MSRAGNSVSSGSSPRRAANTWPYSRGQAGLRDELHAEVGHPPLLAAPADERVLDPQDRVLRRVAAAHGGEGLERQLDGPVAAAVDRDAEVALDRREGRLGRLLGAVVGEAGVMDAPVPYVVDRGRGVADVHEELHQAAARGVAAGPRAGEERVAPVHPRDGERQPPGLRGAVVERGGGRGDERVGGGGDPQREQAPALALHQVEHPVGVALDVMEPRAVLRQVGGGLVEPPRRLAARVPLDRAARRVGAAGLDPARAQRRGVDEAGVEGHVEEDERAVARRLVELPARRRTPLRDLGGVEAPAAGDASVSSCLEDSSGQERIARRLP
jgi:hypothetical protein